MRPCAATALAGGSVLGGAINRRFVTAFAVLCALLVFACALSLSTGAADLGFLKILRGIFCGEFADADKVIFYDIRLPRLLTGILAGASLAGAGAAMQSLFRNPLADPSITGVSAGASLGAVLAIVIFSESAFAGLGLQAGALICGLAATAAIWRLSAYGGRISAASILLTGIAVNAFCSAIVGFAMYSAREAGLKSFIFWTLGSLDASTWKTLASASVISGAAWLFLFSKAKGLNVLSLGARQAHHAGADAGKLQFAAMFCAAAMTASCVALCGIIGFVGLVVPHILRMAAGPDNRTLLPLSALGGAALITFADVISRAVSPTDAVPIGVITALIGAPVFLLILRNPRNVRS